MSINDPKSLQQKKMSHQILEHLMSFNHHQNVKSGLSGSNLSLAQSMHEYLLMMPNAYSWAVTSRRAASPGAEPQRAMPADSKGFALFLILKSHFLEEDEASISLEFPGIAGK